MSKLVSEQTIAAKVVEFFTETLGIGGLFETIAVVSVVLVYVTFLVKFARDGSFRRRLQLANESILRSLASAVGAFVGSRASFEFDERPTAQDDRLVEIIRSELSATGIQLSDASEAEILGYFREALSGDFRDQIRSELQGLIRHEAAIAAYAQIDNNLRRARNRLEAASSSVSVRGVVSLLIGTMSAVAAFSLIYSVIGIVDLEALESMSLNSVLYVSIGRLSLAVFVTFISYFFLSLYRRSLDEIKHYQSEMTNIDAWLASLTASKASGDVGLVAYATAKLLEVDRNANLRQAAAKERKGSQSVRLSDDLMKAIIAKIPTGP